MRRMHHMPFGAEFTEGGGARFRLWAPAARQVDVVLVGGPRPGHVAMRAIGSGWHEATVEAADESTHYAFHVDGKPLVPDPASRSNPDGVHGASRLVDPRAYEWQSAGWRGRPWHEAVVYEMHVGTFTAEGTFAAAVERLDDLAALGVTALELMPVASFSGSRGWGYDGVLLFAPQPAYGTAEDLKRLVDAAHARGLMVLLDVVYNHFGPDGNYLHVYAPQFFNARHQTPWGAAINFDGDENRTVRDFFVHNALYWLEEYQLDGLRLDAIHAIADDSEQHIVEELARAVRDGPGRDRHVHLILENDLNQSRYLPREPDGRVPLATAQWNDDIHHAIHVIATGETDGYYADYAQRPLAQLGRTLAEGFAYQGDPSPYRHGELRGEPSTHLPPLAFVDFLQTHDQVGNRAFGERLVHLAPEDALRALTACVLLAPAVPMLFMGEEFGASSPFQYFCDFTGELAQAVTNGRRSEFGRFARFSDPAVRDRIPDPNDAATFARSQLNWAEVGQPPHQRWRALYRELLSIRHERLVPLLPQIRSGSFELAASGSLLVRWPVGSAGSLHLLAHLGDGTVAAPEVTPGVTLYASHAAQGELPPWSVRWSLELL
jgi:maltooligosyltrehalose trehalohydrolase